MAESNKLRTYVQLIIPIFFILSGFVLFSGAYAANDGFPPLNELVLPLLIISVLIVSAFNAFNAVFDYNVDRINKPDRPLPKKTISKREALAISIALYAIALLLTPLVNNSEFLILVILNILLTIFYSAPNIRLKDSSIITNISIGLQYGVMPLLAGWVLFQSVIVVPAYFILPVFVLAMFIGSIKDFGDFEGDKRYETKTLPVLIGPKRAAKLVITIIFLIHLFLIVYSLLGFFEPILAFILIILLTVLYLFSYKFVLDPVNQGNRFLVISAVAYLLIVLLMAIAINVGHLNLV
jgi:geranylgeranylglycerol-phosphate geranylgeranyltransferase